VSIMADVRAAPLKLLVVLGSAALGACVLGSIGLTGHPCPCVSGWTCDTSTRVCIPVDDGGTKDGGFSPDAAMDSVADRISEASGGDSRAPDSSIDGPAHDAGNWCARRDAGYLLCSDFDLPEGGIDQGFNLGFEYNGSGGSFGFDMGNYVSPPRSAQGAPQAFGPGGTAGVQLSGDLWLTESTPASVTCTVEWLPISIPSTMGVYSHILFLTVYADDDASSELRGIGLNILGTNELQFLDDVGDGTTETTSQNFGPYVPTNPPQWTSVGITLTTGGGITSYSAFVGSSSVMGTLMEPLPSTSHVTLGVGPAYYSGQTTAYTPQWIFDYDNVLCY
jgi:hypothetical protein